MTAAVVICETRTIQQKAMAHSRVYRTFIATRYESDLKEDMKDDTINERRLLLKWTKVIVKD